MKTRKPQRGIPIWKLAIHALCLALVACSASAQQQSPRKSTSSSAASPRQSSSSHFKEAPPPTITDEEVFLYNAVIFGAGVNLAQPYAIQFDTANYKQAMANEFSRAQYLERMQAKVQEEVKKVDFSRKFTIMGQSTLGEYSFASHSFPVFGAGYLLLRNIEVFSVQNSVNKADFIWTLPMSEIEAKAFVKSRTGAGGRIDRSVFTRTIYSILDQKGRTAGVGGAPATFIPFIHSVEVFSDAGLTRKLGTLDERPGIPESAYRPDLKQASQSESKVIGEYPYIAAYPEYWRPSKTPIKGTIKLTDVGIELSGEKSDGTAKVISVGFFDTFGAGSSNSIGKLSRLNFTFGISDFRIVWNSNWNSDHTPFVFAKAEERDRFFADLVQAMQDWATKYPQFALKKLDVDQQVYRQ